MINEEGLMSRPSWGDGFCGNSGGDSLNLSRVIGVSYTQMDKTYERRKPDSNYL